VPAPLSKAPEVRVVAPVPPLATGNVPVVPPSIGNPVTLVITPLVGVPSAGVTKVGLLDSTTLPVPVEAVTPVPPLATGKVPVVPPSIGRPVALVSVPLVGVPNAGVTSVGLVANTSAPEPVSSVTAAAKFALVGVAKNVATSVPKPEMPVDTGRPVALVSVPLEGVPNTPPLTTGAPAEPTLTARAVATPVPRPEMPVATGRPVTLVITPLAGVPNAGVTSVGLVANTKAPEPVSPVTAAARLAELGVSKNVATPAPNAVRPVPPEAAASGEASVRL
jgi:hypothetical protein